MSRPNQWFVPGDGISQMVITADIQRYLGPDSKVRQGLGTGDYEGSSGYWITAQRMLTAQMIQDLKIDSQSWWRKHGRPEVTYNYSSAYPATQGYSAAPAAPYSVHVPITVPGYYVASDGRQYPLPSHLTSTARKPSSPPEGDSRSHRIHNHDKRESMEEVKEENRVLEGKGKAVIQEEEEQEAVPEKTEHEAVQEEMEWEIVEDESRHAAESKNSSERMHREFWNSE